MTISERFLYFTRNDSAIHTNSLEKTNVKYEKLKFRHTFVSFRIVN